MFKRFFDGTGRVFGRVGSRSMTLLAARPTLSFVVLLAILFTVIALGHFLRTPKPDTTEIVSEKKETALFVPLSDTPTLQVPAKVTKGSVAKITALTPGIVSKIYVTRGKTVWGGQTLMSLTNDYNSGRAGLEKALAANNAKLTEELSRIDKKIFQLEEKRIKHDATLTDTEEDIELKELKKSRASRRATLANNPLQLSIAQTNDAVLKPKAFVGGTVESIHVRPGDFVMAGQTLLTLRSTTGVTTLEALVSPSTAALFDATKETILNVDNEKIALLPTYFSQQETVNGLYSILFTLSSTTENKLTDGTYLSLTLPLRAVSLDTILLPIDAVFQDSESATVLVEENGKAVSRTLLLGNTFGSFVEVLSGLHTEDRVILNHSVVSGEEITVR